MELSFQKSRFSFQRPHASFRKIRAPILFSFPVSRSSFSYEHSRFDLISPFCIIALSIIGVFFIYSAQHYQPTDDWTGVINWILNNDWLRQIIGPGVGLTAYFAVSLIDYKIFLKYSHWVYFLALGLLALVRLEPP